MTNTQAKPATDTTENFAEKSTSSTAPEHAVTTGAQANMNEYTTDTSAAATAPIQDPQTPLVQTSTPSVKSERSDSVLSVSVKTKHTDTSADLPANTDVVNSQPPVTEKTTTAKPVIKTKSKPQAKSNPADQAQSEVKLHTQQEPAVEPEPRTTPKESAQTPALTACEPNQHWQACYEAVTGLAHRDANPPLPCQDSAVALNSSRPIVIVADGAGSSAVSELGSQAVTTGLARLLNTLEKQVAQLLDQPDNDSSRETRSFALLLVKHAKGILDDLAATHRRPQKDFRCTLLLAIHGKNQLLWLKIGDGALVTETLQYDSGKLLPTLSTLGNVGKGEFANATTFIDDHLQPSDVQAGSCNSTYITGFAAMSDGAADRLVANAGNQVSSQVSDWLNKLRQGKLKRRELTRLFSSENFTRGTTGDDACVALCASGLTTDAVTSTLNRV